MRKTDIMNAFDILLIRLAELMAHPQIKGFEAKIVESILSEVMEPPQITGWDDIAGLQGPKSIIKVNNRTPPIPKSQADFVVLIEISPVCYTFVGSHNMAYDASRYFQRFTSSSKRNLTVWTS
jgi:hypothetical protein